MLLCNLITGLVASFCHISVDNHNLYIFSYNHITAIDIAVQVASFLEAFDSFESNVYTNLLIS